jgi:hypothetical protein
MMMIIIFSFKEEEGRGEWRKLHKRGASLFVLFINSMISQRGLDERGM